MGDPAGVGPEVVLKALADSAVRRACRPLVLGDLDLLRKIRAGRRRFPKLISWEAGQPIGSGDDGVVVYSLSRLTPTQAQPGRVVAGGVGERAQHVAAGRQVDAHGDAREAVARPVGHAAADAAGWHPIKEVVKPLMGLLFDADSEVRRTAKDSLLRYKKAGLVKGLPQYEWFTEPEEVIREMRFDDGHTTTGQLEGL